MRSLAERLEAHVDRAGLHHRWLGATDAAGIPQIRVDGRLTTARRAAWELARGSLEPGQTVAACPKDPSCIRVAHLSVGRVHRPAAPPCPAPARQRARRGGGSLREVRPGVWEISVVALGGGKRRYRTVHGDRNDAVVALDTLVAETGGLADTLDGLAGAYLAQLAERGRSPHTLRRYGQLWRQWISPTLGLTVPDTVRRSAIEGVLGRMARAGQSDSSVHQAAVLLSGCFAWAQRERRVDHNPALGARLPSGARLAPPRRR
jgi:hypothetical protein